MSIGGLPIKGVINSFDKIKAALSSSSYNPLLFAVAGTIKCTVSLIENLPEDFAQLQMTYYTKISEVNKNAKEKYLCLICGEMIFSDAPSTVPEALGVRLIDCNRDLHEYVYWMYCLLLAEYGNTRGYFPLCIRQPRLCVKACKGEHDNKV
jgi:hypothetical protein